MKIKLILYEQSSIFAIFMRYCAHHNQIRKMQYLFRKSKLYNIMYSKICRLILKIHAVNLPNAIFIRTLVHIFNIVEIFFSFSIFTNPC